MSTIQLLDVNVGLPSPLGERSGEVIMSGIRKLPVTTERVEVSMLVGPNADAHVYSPSPADAKKLADAKVVVVNGLGYEGWLARLIKASGSKAAVVTATKGFKPIRAAGGHGHGHGHSRDSDPHAWQSVANVKLYAANVRDGLVAADPAGNLTVVWHNLPSTTPTGVFLRRFVLR